MLRGVCIPLARCRQVIIEFVVAEDLIDNVDSVVTHDEGYRSGYVGIHILTFIHTNMALVYFRSLKVAITRFLLENITREKPNVAQFYLGLMGDFAEPDLSASLCFNTVLAKLSGTNCISILV